MNTLRQLLAVLAAIFGILGASTATLQLPLPVSVVLIGIGGAVMAIDHYVNNT